MRSNAAVLSLCAFFYDEWHYVLFTGIDDKNIYLFDPYYRTEPFNESDIKIVLDKPFEYNRIVPIEYFNSLDEKLYSLASPDRARLL